MPSQKDQKWMQGDEGELNDQWCQRQQRDQEEQELRLSAYYRTEGGHFGHAVEQSQWNAIFEKQIEKGKLREMTVDV